MTIKLDHINLTVANLNDSIEWYGRVFGFQLVESGVTYRGNKWGIVAFNDSMICMTELTGRISADSFDDKSAHRIDHFGIRVSDVEKWRQIIEENNLKIYHGGEIEYPFSKSWYVHDPSGHEIEVSYTSHEKLQFPSNLAV
jgi:catechol 2,3-dioxygenase-like lactoylglutathione lyase family enzyme